MLAIDYQEARQESDAVALSIVPRETEGGVCVARAGV